MTPPDKKDLSEAFEMIDMITAPKSKKIKPIAVKTEILETMDKYIAPFRDGKNMEKGLSIIRGLREELSNMHAPDFSRYNLEITEAIEAK